MLAPVGPDRASQRPVFEMAARFLRETPYRDHFGASTDNLTATIAWLVDHGYLVAALRDGDHVGLLAGTIFPHMVTGELAATEVMWWVEPDARTTRAAFLLLRAFEAWATERGATTIQMGGWNDRLDTFYQRLGYRPAEQIYIKRVGA